MGLPVISSDRPFNDGLLTPENSIRVDPTDQRAVADAIIALRDDHEGGRAWRRAREKPARFCKIDARARDILRFMEERL